MRKWNFRFVTFRTETEASLLEINFIRSYISIVFTYYSCSFADFTFCFSFNFSPSFSSNFSISTIIIVRACCVCVVHSLFVLLLFSAMTLAVVVCCRWSWKINETCSLLHRRTSSAATSISLFVSSWWRWTQAALFWWFIPTLHLHS